MVKRRNKRSKTQVINIEDVKGRKVCIDETRNKTFFVDRENVEGEGECVSASERERERECVSERERECVNRVDNGIHATNRDINATNRDTTNQGNDSPDTTNQGNGSPDTTNQGNSSSDNESLKEEIIKKAMVEGMEVEEGLSMKVEKSQAVKADSMRMKNVRTKAEVVKIKNVEAVRVTSVGAVRVTNGSIKDAGRMNDGTGGDATSEPSVSAAERMNDAAGKDEPATRKGEVTLEPGANSKAPYDNHASPNDSLNVPFHAPHPNGPFHAPHPNDSLHAPLPNDPTVIIKEDEKKDVSKLIALLNSRCQMENKESEKMKEGEKVNEIKKMIGGRLETIIKKQVQELVQEKSAKRENETRENEQENEKRGNERECVNRENEQERANREARIHIPIATTTRSIFTAATAETTRDSKISKIIERLGMNFQRISSQGQSNQNGHLQNGNLQNDLRIQPNEIRWSVKEKIGMFERGFINFERVKYRRGEEKSHFRGEENPVCCKRREEGGIMINIPSQLAEIEDIVINIKQGPIKKS